MDTAAGTEGIAAAIADLVAAAAVVADAGRAIRRLNNCKERRAGSGPPFLFTCAARCARGFLLYPEVVRGQIRFVVAAIGNTLGKNRNSTAMKSSKFSSNARGVFVLWGLALVGTLPSQSGSTPPPVINSITVQETNLILVANVPAGVQKVWLDVRPKPDAPWESKGPLGVPEDGGRINLRLPKPDRSTFFRMKAALSASTNNLVSVESAYIVIAPLAPAPAASTNSGPASSPDAILRVRATIDGNDRIRITRGSALWEHVDWNWPLSVINANDAEWSPRLLNYLATAGQGKLLPDGFSLKDATVEILSGRGSVTLEHADDEVIVKLDDPAAGASEYDVRIHFPPTK
jgi:hypothetical protein